MLLPTKVDLVLMKKSYKSNSVWTCSSTSGKVVLTLMIKFIAFHMRLAAINIRGLGLKFVPSLAFLWCLGLENGLDDLVQVLLHISDDILGL